MVERGGSWFQRRWQTGFDGKETNVDEKRVDYVLGSGNHARTYLHLTDNNGVAVGGWIHDALVNGQVSAWLWW